MDDLDRPPGAGTPDEAAGARSRLRLLAWATVAALLVQFLLGMADNLYLVIPAHHSWTDAHPLVLLYAHVVVGLALLGNSFMVLARSHAAGSPVVVAAALIGLAGIVVAVIFGVAFVSDGQANSASLGMSGGFALAVVSYAGVLWAVPRS